MRPALLTAHRRLWRDPTTLQLGRSGGRAAVVHGLDPALRPVLDLLDGSYDRATVLAAAAVQGCEPARAEALVELLTGAGLLDDAGQDRAPLLGLRADERERMTADLACLALLRGDGGVPALALRRAVSVLVVGAGRVGAPLAVALATAGIGAVDVVDDELARPQDTGVGGLGLRDVGRPRGQAARELVHRAAPSLSRLPVVRPDLVVLASGRDDVRERARRLCLDGTAHLLVEVREATGVVGPLVLPGRTPCLRCLDLTRSDLDPAWPVLAHQLPAAGEGDPGCDGPLALAVAAQAAMQVLAMADGTTVPASLGGTLEMALPDWRWRRRSWPLHADCGCAAAPRETDGAPRPRPAPARRRSDTGPVSDIPRRAVTRSAKLAGLPLGAAGRATIGLGKRLGGRPAEVVTAELQARTAEQLFQVLGQLKGGAMKLGQALSVFEAALPEDMAAPYRAALTKLQEAAPPLPAATVHAVLALELGPTWRELFEVFDDRPAAAASIGQVHKAVWHDGREVAVKIQYPGAGPALLADLKQLGRVARMFSVFTPGLDVKPLIEELEARVAEELDYRLEAEAQTTFATAYDGDQEIRIPQVVTGTERVLVTEWMEGVPLSKIISDGTTAERDRASLLLARFLLSGPVLAGLLHADPHPGNFRLLPDGRLGVIDFGAVNRLPDGSPEPIGRLARLALAGEAELVLEGLRSEGFVKGSVEVDAGEVLDYLLPLLEPVDGPSFRFSRAWLREQAIRVGDPRSPASQLGRQLNLPPSYLLIHRVTMGTIGVLCQLGGTADYRAEVERWQPGFSTPARQA